MEHLWHEIGSCAGGARFELTLRGCAARICLMDAENYQAYRDEDEDGYQCYYGGFWEASPVELVLPYDGLLVPRNRQLPGTNQLLAGRAVLTRVEGRQVGVLELAEMSEHGFAAAATATRNDRGQF